MSASRSQQVREPRFQAQEQVLRKEPRVGVTREAHEIIQRSVQNQPLASDVPAKGTHSILLR